MAMQQDITSTDSAPCFRPRRIGHTNIFVGNLERSMAFYENVLGIKEAWRRENICAGFVNNGNTHHDVGMVDIINPQFHDQSLICSTSLSNSRLRSTWKPGTNKRLSKTGLSASPTTMRSHSRST